MSDLKSRLLKAIEMDRARLNSCCDHMSRELQASGLFSHAERSRLDYAIGVGARYESARLRPLLLELVECVEALESYRSEWNPAASNALVNLEERLKGVE